MASQENIRKYLAYWFQLGKRVVAHNGSGILKPETVLDGERYSQEFENCWQQIISNLGRDYYLEGTEQTISQLLSPEWNISDCARCNMPIPRRDMGLPALLCPCDDLSPNMDLPLPHSPVNSKEQLASIRDRISVP